MCKGYIKSIGSRTKINAHPLNLVRPFLDLACSVDFCLESSFPPSVVIQFATNRTKLRIVGEQKGGKRLAASCHNLLLFSGLRRLRQDLVNLNSRLDGRRSIQLSYGRNHIDSKTFTLRRHTVLVAFSRVDPLRKEKSLHLNES